MKADGQATAKLFSFTEIPSAFVCARALLYSLISIFVSNFKTTPVCNRMPAIFAASWSTKKFVYAGIEISTETVKETPRFTLLVGAIETAEMHRSGIRRKKFVSRDPPTVPFYYPDKRTKGKSLGFDEKQFEDEA
ncbi:unnamed protein product [Xylocopa violacea]|uniref:Ribosomal protein L33 n=1 Tax=Xylocopa violacea TaxID=135666 RepID=A0ABP1N8X1_XYLVO